MAGPASKGSGSIFKRLARFIEHHWYQSSPLANLWLLPLWLIAAPVIYLKYWRGQKHARQMTGSVSTPVLVVGNISVGGTGKTPLITCLAERVQQAGFSAGIISRGYGGNSQVYPLLVDDQTDASVCGDEPKLLKLRLDCPIVVDPQRKRAAEALQGKVDIIISDDGLQHYQLQRQAEIVVVDAEREFGNGWLLPIGPLREPVSRLQSVDLVMRNGDDFTLQPTALVNAKTGEQQDLSWLANKDIHAVAGIGHPSRFFRTLKQLQANITEHSFADHHLFTQQDLTFHDTAPIVMTEKDWVKCQVFATGNMWYLSVSVQMSDTMTEKTDQLISRLLPPARPATEENRG